jgi:hypothetical protein
LPRRVFPEELQRAIDITAGHGETVAVVEGYLRELEGDPPAR